MNTNQIQIGTKVERIASDYTGGRKGTVIETKNGRARIVWDAGHPRTWIQFASLRVIATSGTVKGAWIETPNSNRTVAVRVCINEKRGEVWHEYKKRTP